MHSIPESQEKVDAIASIIDYQDGGEVQHEIIQYLDERAENENVWLQDLNTSEIPTTLIWGLLDPVAPTRVADYVWETYLKYRITPSDYWQLPSANHYLQNDQSDMLCDLIRGVFGESIDFGVYEESDIPIHIASNP
jgi:pimeloyl-ACP methyl ester carboxylesterase